MRIHHHIIKKKKDRERIAALNKTITLIHNTRHRKVMRAVSSMCCSVKRKKSLSPPLKEGRRRRRPSTDDSVETTPLEDSLRSYRSEELLQSSTLRHTSNTASMRHSFNGVNNKSVSFGSIQIYSHSFTLGDNPSVSSGPPVAMDREPFESGTFDLDEYEKEKPEPRRKEAMILPRSVREELLRNEGFSRGETKIATEEASKIRKQRLKSSNNGKLIRKLEKCWRRRGRAAPSPVMDEDRVE